MTTIATKLYVRSQTALDDTRSRLAEASRNDRGEVTANTAFIVLLVVAAITAGGVIAAKLVANANKVPSP